MIFTFETTPEQDTAIAFAIAWAAHQRRRPLEREEPAETPAQFFARSVTHTLAPWVDRMRQARAGTRTDLFDRASDADKATIDAILERYREDAPTPAPPTR